MPPCPPDHKTNKPGRPPPAFTTGLAGRRWEQCSAQSFLNPLVKRQGVLFGSTDYTDDDSSKLLEEIPNHVSKTLFSSAACFERAARRVHCACGVADRHGCADPGPADRDDSANR